MIFLILLLNSFLLCTASQDQCLILDMQVGSRLAHALAASELYDILLEDNRPPCRSGFLVYPGIETALALQDKKKMINDGFLPLSGDAKRKIATLLLISFPDNKNQAIACFEKFATDEKLYPLSVQKTLEMIDLHYEQKKAAQIEESLSITIPTGRPRSRSFGSMQDLLSQAPAQASESAAVDQSESDDCDDAAVDYFLSLYDNEQK